MKISAARRLAAAFLRRHTGRRVAPVLRPLRGGLESDLVAEVSGGGARFVMKWIPPGQHREVHVLRTLRAVAGLPAPALLEARGSAATGWIAFLEWIEPWRTWPWGDPAHAAQVCESMALAHERAPRRGAFLWDFESELAASAESTAEFLNHRLASRLAARLPRIRRDLLLHPVALHGDVHSANVIVRWRGGPEPVFIDWGRARIGSAFEDVASWLQSLGYWEPEARRRHDTLLAHYLGQRGGSTKITASVREEYWLAAACNGFGGAMRYHAAVARDPARDGAARQASQGALSDWMRILRRADAYSR